MTLKQSFLFNTLFTLGVNLLIKPIWVFGIDRTVQNRLGESDYGLYFAIFNFTYLFQILLDFGLQNFNQTEIAADNNKLRKILPGMLLTKLVMTVSYLVLTIGVAIALGYAAEKFFPWLLLNQILLSFNIFLRSNISANRLFIKDAFLSICDKVLMIIGCSLMLSGIIPALQLNIENFVFIQTISLAITTVFCVFFIHKLVPDLEWNLNEVLLLKIIRQALPFAAIYFLMTLYYRIDTVMIEQMLGQDGAKEAGIYAQSYRIMESVNNLGYLVAGLLLPLFAFRIGQKQSFMSELRHGFGLMLCIAVPIITGGYFYAPEIIATLYPGTDSIYSANIFRILLLNFFPVAILYVFGPLLTANRSFRWMIISLVIASSLNVLLNYLLIPDFGAFGASFATLVTQTIMLISYTLALYKIFKINFSASLAARTTAFIALTILLNGLIYRTQLHWFPALVITGTLSLAAGWILKVISMDTLRLKIH